ncbi:MAG: metallophosphoesterase [Pirellulaceae bacterium]|nr:metallophosphoesterase [Pirellulaceae bacterium]
MTTLRVVGDVHGQLDRDGLCVRNARPYLEIIADAPWSIQLGDMGDGETYDQLIAQVDASRHRFFPGNHDHYDCLPPHSLGDFGAVGWGGVHFFFIRGAASTDREKLVRRGRELGKTLWFAEEELTAEQMRQAEEQYLQAMPSIVISHDAPTDIARFAAQHSQALRPPDPSAVFHPSRTNDFLARLLQQHSPQLWLFGHHHRDWRYQHDATLFVCVGQLSYVDVDAAGNLE